jgi:hypothetical protein
VNQIYFDNKKDSSQSFQWPEEDLDKFGASKRSEFFTALDITIVFYGDDPTPYMSEH